MHRLSKWIEKLETLAERRFGRWFDRHRKRLKLYIPLALLGWYFYGMFLNSIRLGNDWVFHSTGEAVESIWVWNPFANWFVLFTPFGLGVTAVVILLICLITKKGYSKLSGYKYIRDARGFDILPDGTHGTSGFLTAKEGQSIILTQPLPQLSGTILGKYKDRSDDDDKYAQYVAVKPGSGLTEHTMVYGSTGSGKSRGFVKPFILQCVKRKESLILVDPKGEFFETMSAYLQDQGYEVKLFNLLDMENSDGWNCLDDKGNDPNLVQSMAEVIIHNTSGGEEKEDFWSKAELNLLVALLHYVRSLPLPIEERSLGAVYRILASEQFGKLEAIFAALPRNHPAQAPYGIFKLANKQIWGNIAIGLGNRLAVFQNPLVDKITAFSEIDLTRPGQKPCAYFCAISDQDSSLQFLSSLFFSQLFTRLMGYARKECPNGRMPVTVNVCLEEFCNIGKLTDFKKVLSVCRSRGIFCQLIVQSVSQLSDRYPRKEWEELIGNCDVQICLGCNDQMTAEYISNKCGNITIGVKNNQFPLLPLFAPIYSNTRPYSQTRSNTQRALMMPDEVLHLDNKKCLVFLRGQKPMLLHKIIPDEFEAFSGLHTISVQEHIPQWRTAKPPQPTTPPAPVDTIQEDDALGMVEKPAHSLWDDDEEDFL